MKRDFQQMFLDVDGPLATEMAEIVRKLNSESPREQHEQVSLLCHRIRGDARTVGFSVIGDLTGIIEEALPIRSPGHSLDTNQRQELRLVADEIERRMSGGRSVCNEPPSGEILALLARRSVQQDQDFEA
jgi:chemotaxis protein histidine kinase CheA